MKLLDKIKDLFMDEVSEEDEFELDCVFHDTALFSVLSQPVATKTAAIASDNKDIVFFFIYSLTLLIFNFIKL